MKIFKTAMTTTALATMFIAIGSMTYAMNEEDNNRSPSATKTQNLPKYFQKVKFDLNPTGLSQDIVRDTHWKIRKVITDNNADASYQVKSTPFSVTPGQKIQVLYDITVEKDGAMSIGLLNTAKNNWYGTELILNEGTYNGLYERVVPEEETETCLVFRNYHLGTPGQTTFTINDINIKKEMVAGIEAGKGDDEIPISTAIQIAKLKEGTTFSFNTWNESHDYIQHGNVSPSRKFSVYWKGNGFDEECLKDALQMVPWKPEWDNVAAKYNEWSYNESLQGFGQAWDIQFTDFTRNLPIFGSGSLSLTITEIIEEQKTEKPYNYGDGVNIHRYIIDKEYWPAHWKK